MKKLMFIIPALAIFASCTNPKTEGSSNLMGKEVLTEKTDSLSTVVIQKAEKMPVVDNGAVLAASKPAVIAEAPKAGKKKWSNKKKGVIIGAASGAVVGAAVSKKRVKGAVIGGVVGGGVGLGTGAILDNNEKKKQQ